MAPSKLEHDRLQMIRGLEDLVKSMKHCVETSEAYLTSYKATFSSNGQEEDVKPGKGKRKHSDTEEPAVDGKRKRIVKAKDPNAPRRPASTYLLFQNEMRKATKQDHPNITFQELTSLMSKMWSEMSAAEKQTYVDQHDALNKKYEEEMTAYKALTKGDDEDEEGSAPAAKSKTVRAPKEKASDKVKEKAKKDEKAEKAKDKQKEKERETEKEKDTEKEKEKEKEREREQEKAKAKPRKSTAPVPVPPVESDTSEEEEEEEATSSSSSDSSEDESSPEPVPKKAKTSAPASTATTKKRKA
ncbi:HMG-box [Armillaria gallica]|uniref:HMG-box n=1 Tax=Armillaria gallica TaxID=47427 RepID=A0A2H3E757_ARMGA|nr:HMG-box [Armillaria gallica]